MATKAVLFKAESQRTKHKPPRIKKQPRLIDPHNTGTRNFTKRADKAVGMVLEDSLSGTPSRKSTRKASHGGRNDQQILRAVRGKLLSPQARAKRAQVARKK